MKRIYVEEIRALSGPIRACDEWFTTPQSVLITSVASDKGQGLVRTGKNRNLCRRGQVRAGCGRFGPTGPTVFEP